MLCFLRTKIYFFVIIIWIFTFHFDCHKFICNYHIAIYLLSCFMYFDFDFIDVLLIQFFSCIRIKLSDHNNQPYNLIERWYPAIQTNSESKLIYLWGMVLCWMIKAYFEIQMNHSECCYHLHMVLFYQSLIWSFSLLFTYKVD